MSIFKWWRWLTGGIWILVEWSTSEYNFIEWKWYSKNVEKIEAKRRAAWSVAHSIILLEDYRSKNLKEKDEERNRAIDEHNC